MSFWGGDAVVRKQPPVDYRGLTPYMPRVCGAGGPPAGVLTAEPFTGKRDQLGRCWPGQVEAGSRPGGQRVSGI